MQDINIYTKASDIARRGGQLPMFEADLGEELKRVLESEKLSTFNVSYGGLFPLSETQAEIEREANRMVKLRSLSDKVLMIFFSFFQKI